MPIISDGGRPKSVRTPSEEDELLLEDINRLPEKERAALLEIYGNLLKGDNQGFAGIVDAEYETIPVDIRTFLTDAYFLGEVGRSLWPALQDDMAEMFEGGYNEAILGGSLGYGKSFYSTTALSYVLYQMLCLRSPQRAYGIDPGSNIYIAMLSVTEKVARRVVINEFIGKVGHSPFFKEVGFKAAPSMMEIRFPKQVQVIAGSTGSSAIIGLNAFAGFIDEASFMGDTKQVDRQGRIVTVDQAEAIYKSILRRMKSRFQRVGRLPGLLIVASSKERPAAFIERRIVLARDEQDPSVFIREYAIWDVKPSDQFAKTTFKVVAGNDRYQSRILSGDPEEEARYRDVGLQIVEVPEDYRRDFEHDLDGALRDLAGVATEAISPFIARTEKIHDAIDGTLPTPLGSDDWVAGSPLEIAWERVAVPFERTLPGGYKEVAWRPSRHPGAVRYVHIDQSLSGDASGIVIAHVAGWTEVVRRDSKGDEYNEIAPVIETDLVLRVVPPPGDEIVLGDLRAIIYQYMEHGFNIAFASMDRWQSADALQQLRGRGMEAEVVSVDKTQDPYDLLKTALYEGRLRLHRNVLLVDELQHLQRVPKPKASGFKIDHPPKGTKDVADSLAGVVYSLTQRTPGRPIPPVKEDRGVQAQEDHSWVTGGRVMVEVAPSNATPQGRTPRSGKGAPPLPFVRG